MDERLISQALQDTARKDIPDDMNMWPEVQAQMGRMTRSAARSRVSWVAAAILTMLAVSAVAYAAAVLLQGGYLDPGMQGASEADLVTVLNMEQTVDGVTVKLDYAYADANRISIGYRSSGEAPLGTTYSFASEKLTDSAGHEFQTMFGGGGGGGGGDDNSNVVSFSQQHEGSYDVSIIQDSPTQLDMRLEIGMIRNVSTRLNDGGTPQPVPGNPETTPVGPFVFEFTIPFIRGQVVEPQQKATASGIRLVLQRLVIAPSMTRGSVCVEPAPSVDYVPRMSLSVDGETVDLGAIPPTFASAPEGSPAGCYDLQINQSLYQRSGEWNLSIDSLATYLPVSISSGSNGTTIDFSIDGAPEVLAQVRAKLEPALQPYGITLTATDGGLKYSYALNAGIDEQAIRDLVDSTMREETPGPWTFAFTVPPAS